MDWAENSPPSLSLSALPYKSRAISPLCTRTPDYYNLQARHRTEEEHTDTAMGGHTSHHGAASHAYNNNDSHDDNSVDNSQHISGQNISGQEISGNMTGNFSIGNQTNTTRHSASPETPQKTVVPSITIANVTGGKVRLYYKSEEMALSDLIKGSHLSKGDSILILDGTVKKTDLPQSLYVTCFQVENGNTQSCPEEGPMYGLDNLLAEYDEGHPKSYILTADKELKVAETGKIWVDEDGVDHNPKK
ncbi:uncharacterized protein LOC109865216 isoform X5 [Oncorhynchus kisutch]|uniref:uncharacterized protein LOC109865216 isoform X5 n=1 Tax=Oncorhynchus kisutch TaxID=8019 RepID=UPI0012DF1EED|nr:uncharacterized protein LOC109865216 isoform X5 [Oncorhynchus kisutch]XP_031655213.1 uncharacterized protein LOC109865216 isoform X5 [Oncorhynchus kisutch]